MQSRSKIRLACILTAILIAGASIALVAHHKFALREEREDFINRHAFLLNAYHPILRYQLKHGGKLPAGVGDLNDISDTFRVDLRVSSSWILLWGEKPTLPGESAPPLLGIRSSLYDDGVLYLTVDGEIKHVRH